MKVAGSILKNNIIGKTILPITFNNGQKTVTLFIDFLIANHLNGYKSIMGASFLMNTDYCLAITPKNLYLSNLYNNFVIPLFYPSEKISCTPLQIQSTNVTENSTKILHITNKLGTNSQIYSRNNNIQILDTQSDKDSSKLLILNTSSLPITIDNNCLFLTNYIDVRSDHGILSPQSPQPENIQINNLSISADQYDTIDEQIINESLLIDPTNLEQQFSYKDCTINKNLPDHITQELTTILQDHQSVFAKTKLDVGKFKGFMVDLQIDSEIPRQQQRPMSDEKAAYCDKTFKVFEKLGLVEECHTPKTVSNLLLVPKYEGIHDLTKASTFLAQQKGLKNNQFRIVQDLRKINKTTKNIKRTIPKLPEKIFQQLKGKIVSSIDCNQAYWHLLLNQHHQQHVGMKQWKLFSLRLQ